MPKIMPTLGPRDFVRGCVLLLPRKRGGRAAGVRFRLGEGSIGEEGQGVEGPEATEGT